ncbi:hypothetical protein [Nonomuraea maritima]|uniref:hypothetical protein n=1 Tax=Nonomuraea maritima TaxID=683260 RepID=UPI00371F993E
MADHDRHAGSRGEEEAPRDPTSAPDPGHRPDTFPALKYGEQAGHPYAFIPPGIPPGIQTGIPPGIALDSPPADAVDRPPGLRDWLGRRKTQVAGAGALGLVVGALLGGITVSALSDLTPSPDDIVVREEGSVLPPDMRGECYQQDGALYCVLPPPDPDPTWAG